MELDGLRGTVAKLEEALSSSESALGQMRESCSRVQSERDVAVDKCGEVAQEILRAETLYRNAIEEIALKVQFPSFVCLIFLCHLILFNASSSSLFNINILFPAGRT